MKYQSILNAMTNTCWAILPEKLHILVGVLNTRIRGSVHPEDDIVIEARKPAPRGSGGATGVIQIFGTIAQRMDAMDAMSGGTSAEDVGAAMDDMLGNSGISSIVLQIDSPGGSVYGIQELGDKIHAARDSGKRVIAVADSMSASAAYWLGTQAGKFYMTPGGEVGSVGVVAMHIDQSKLNESMGITPTYIHAGQFKVEGNPHAPLDDQAKAAIQSRVDDYYGAFVSAVARGRGTTQKDVRDNFGQGRMMGAGDAVKYGMVDGVKTFEQVISELSGRKSVATARRAMANAEG